MTEISWGESMSYTGITEYNYAPAASGGCINLKCVWSCLSVHIIWTVTKHKYKWWLYQKKSASQISQSPNYPMRKFCQELSLSDIYRRNPSFTTYPSRPWQTYSYAVPREEHKNSFNKENATRSPKLPFNSIKDWVSMR